MGLILMIETATPVCSVGLAKQGHLLGVKEDIRGNASHNQLLHQYIQTIFEKTNFKLHDIDAIAVSGGPGSYTGLRIGCSTAKGIAFGCQKPLLSIDTLKALAWRAIQQTEQQKGFYIPMIDARGMGAYTAVFNEQLEEIEPIKLQKVNEQTFEKYTQQTTYFFGTALVKYQSLFHEAKNISLLSELYCSAENMIELAQMAWNKQAFQDLAYFEPAYLSKYIPHISNKGKI